MIYRVGICDDEVSTCSQIENVVRELFKNRKETVETYVWNSGEGIIRDINAKVDLDILFLDIELPVYNGVEVGRYIRNSLQNGLMHIIYISSKTNYAMELFKIHPYDFLVKPIDKDRIIEIIDKTILINENDRRFFTYVYNSSSSIISAFSDANGLKFSNNSWVGNSILLLRTKKLNIKNPERIIVVK